MKTFILALAFFATIGGAVSIAKAQTFDIEIDPIAYALNGYSVHGGYLWKSFRLDVGVFGIDVPEFAHGNEGFKNRMDGAGAKLDYFLVRPGQGIFVGLESGVVRAGVEWTDTGDDASRIHYMAGARSGYRVLLGERFVITPWIGFGYTLNAQNQHLAGQTFKTKAFQPFPTIHVGYQF